MISSSKQNFNFLIFENEQWQTISGRVLLSEGIDLEKGGLVLKLFLFNIYAYKIARNEHRIYWFSNKQYNWKIFVIETVSKLLIYFHLLSPNYFTLSSIKFRIEIHNMKSYHRTTVKMYPKYKLYIKLL